MIMKTKRDEMIEELHIRRADPPEPIDNSSLPAGAPMFFSCISCGHHIIVPETWITKPDLCIKCEELQKLGWLAE